MIGRATDFARRLLSWYRRHRRDLPWRVRPSSPVGERPEAYRVLLSEMMLQQTQVATVIPYFHQFLARFPTIEALAGAESQEVLRLWQGLGYYSRARNLHACAQAICREHGGAVPRDVPVLLSLPGIGRYSAGAIASLAFDVRASLVDGNVSRVLCRLDHIAQDPRLPAIQRQLWRRAEELLPEKRAGDFNSAMMELGATVCTPRSPQCLTCPVRMHCRATEAGAVDRIPAPRSAAKPVPLMRRCVVCVESGKRFLIEQRPSTGRWAGLWQFKTLDLDGQETSDDAIVRALGFGVTDLRKIGRISHALSHRRYRFEVFGCKLRGKRRPNQTWATLEETREVPMSRPHVKVQEMLEQARRANQKK